MDSKPIYKTAEELSIEQWEHDGLVSLIGPLSRGELLINMHYADPWRLPCGTFACIGGHLALQKEIDGGVYVKSSVSGSLRTLFHPCGLPFIDNDDAVRSADLSHSGWRAQHTQAARAIVNFLVTGDPQWDAVMATP